MQQAVAARARQAVLIRVATLLSVTVLGACWNLPPPSDQISHTVARLGCNTDSCGTAEDQIEVTYLGTSGVLIRYRGASLLTAPFFSKPVLKRLAISMLPWGPGSSLRITPDTALIERFLPPSADNASGILVGHGHYDHLLDVSYIANHRAKSARIYGGPSIRHMLMGDSALRSDGGSRLVAIPLSRTGTRDHAGEWIYTGDRRFRFMALAATHAPTVKRLGRSYHFAEGRLSRDLRSLPATAFGWKLGEPYAFLIDVLAPDDTIPRFRIYYQDAPSTPPHGFAPSVALRERPVDLAVICAATSTYLKAVPDSLLKTLAPQNVMITHWESLFRRGTLSVQFNAAWDIDNFIARVRRGVPTGSSWAMPVPQTVMRFESTAN